MKKAAKKAFSDVPRIAFILMAAAGLLLYSNEAAKGVKDGTSLMFDILIPSLFPFMVLSSYIVNSGAFDSASKSLSPLLTFLFKLSGNAFPAIILGLIGGYPVGAMTTATLYKRQKITQNEAERLMLFSVNGGPAFLITAIGVGIYQNKMLGIILYCSVIVSSLIVGICLRFLFETEEKEKSEYTKLSRENAFTMAVSEASKSIIGVFGWVLTFSCIGGLIDTTGITGYYSAILKGVLEISTGSRACAGVTPIPVLVSLVSFGGIAVICQIKPYADECKVKIKKLVTIRVIAAAISAFICSNLLNIFKLSVDTVIQKVERPVFSAYSAYAGVLLLIMCALFLLDVETKRKKC